MVTAPLSAAINSHRFMTPQIAPWCRNETIVALKPEDEEQLARKLAHVRCGSKAEELTASTTGLLHPLGADHIADVATGRLRAMNGLKRTVLIRGRIVAGRLAFMRSQLQHVTASSSLSGPQTSIPLRFIGLRLLTRPSGSTGAPTPAASCRS